MTLIQARDPVDFLVVGAGPAGLSAALVASGNGIETVLLERSPEVGGQVWRADHPIPDLLGWTGGDGASLARTFGQQIRESSASLRTRVTVETLEAQASGGVLATLEGGDRLLARRVLLATGLTPRRLGVRGEELAELVRSPRREADRYRGLRVVVIGGGDEACDTARGLADAGATVKLLARLRLRARAQFAARVVHPNIDVELGSRVSHLEGAEGRLTEVVLSDGRHLPADACFVRIGGDLCLPKVEPPLDTTPEGLIWTDSVCRTSSPMLFAGGDLRRPGEQRYLAAAIADGVVVARQVETELRG